MKKTITLLLGHFIFLSVFYAQTTGVPGTEKTRGLAWDIGPAYTRILCSTVGGGNADLKYYSGRMGLDMYVSAFSGLNSSDSFGYRDRQPEVSYSEFGFGVQYLLYHSRKIYAWANLINGIAFANLGDKSVQVRHRNRNGTATYRPKVMASNTYYLVEPGIDGSYVLFHSPRTAFALLATGKVKYHGDIGGSSFAHTGDFEGMMVSVGITVAMLPRL